MNRNNGQLFEKRLVEKHVKVRLNSPHTSEAPQVPCL